LTLGFGTSLPHERSECFGYEIHRIAGHLGRTVPVLLYLANGEIRLTPFYDLVCTRAIERIDYHLAFAVGDERNPSVVTRKHWEILASQCDLRPQFLLNQVNNVATRLLDNLTATKTAFESQYGAYPALQRIEQVVTKQCRRARDI